MTRQLAAAVLCASVIHPLAADAGQLRDGTRVHLRLLGIITSETATDGQALQFVVTQDVVTGGDIVIAKGTAASGAVVKSKAADWDFWGHHHPKLKIRFNYTTAGNGRIVAFRASPDPLGDPYVTIDWQDRDHDLVWAGPATTFEAYVDGNYEW
jgi:hypothetical protein